MKRAELETGKDYLLSNSTDWKHTSYGVERVTVLTTEPYQDTLRSHFYNSERERDLTLPDGSVVKAWAKKATTGSGVLVRSSRRVEVVPLGQLRGPWDAAHTEWEAVQTAKAERDAQVRDRATARRDRHRALVARAESMGLAGASGPEYEPTDTIEITHDLFEALLDNYGRRVA